MNNFKNLLIAVLTGLLALGRVTRELYVPDAVDDQAS